MADEIKEGTATPEGEKATEKTDTEKKSEQLDYKALYEEEKGLRNKAESIIQRHKKPKEDIVDVEGFDDEQSSDKIENLINEKFSNLESKLLTEKIDTSIARLSDNLDKQKLIRYHYENSINRTGNMDVDLENAEALADKKRLKAQNDELKATILSKETRSEGSVGGRKVASEDISEPHLTDIDRKIVNELRTKYVLPNDAIRRILKGESLDSLLETGVIKKR